MCKGMKSAARQLASQAALIRSVDPGLGDCAGVFQIIQVLAHIRSNRRDGHRPSEHSQGYTSQDQSRRPFRGRANEHAVLSYW